MANNPGVARVAFSQLMQLLENNRLDTRLRELMIMRIGWVTGSAYEWTQHWRVATTAGIPPEDILAVRDWQNSGRLNPTDRAILAATDECLAGKSISDAAWAEVAKHVTDPGQQVEFVIAMGNWLSFSMLFRNLRIPLAEGLKVWDVPEVWLAHTLSPNHTEDITGHVDTKVAALEAHRSQLTDDQLAFFKQWMPTAAAEAGKKIGVDAGEEFRVLRFGEP